MNHQYEPFRLVELSPLQHNIDQYLEYTLHYRPNHLEGGSVLLPAPPRPLRPLALRPVLVPRLLERIQLLRLLDHDDLQLVGAELVARVPVYGYVDGPRHGLRNVDPVLPAGGGAEAVLLEQVGRVLVLPGHVEVGVPLQGGEDEGEGARVVQGVVRVVTLTNLQQNTTLSW